MDPQLAFRRSGSRNIHPLSPTDQVFFSKSVIGPEPSRLEAGTIRCDAWKNLPPSLAVWQAIAHAFRMSPAGFSLAMKSVKRDGNRLFEFELGANCPTEGAISLNLILFPGNWIPEVSPLDDSPLGLTPIICQTGALFIENKRVRLP